MTPEEKLTRAKNRCRDCFAVVQRNSPDAWWCDAAFCPIEQVELCHEWEDDRGSLNNPEWQ